VPQSLSADPRKTRAEIRGVKNVVGEEFVYFP